MLRWASRNNRMMSGYRPAPRGLTVEEAAAWQKLAESVTPLSGAVRKNQTPIASSEAMPPQTPAKTAVIAQARRDRIATPPPKRTDPRPKHPAGLDSHWERRLKSGSLDPDFTLDLHGHGLDSAYHRLDRGVAQARAMGARVILLIAGKHRPVEAADRGASRGAIRAKVLDWLAAGPHGSAIAAVRKAHRKHGGEGALYLVLRRER